MLELESGAQILSSVLFFFPMAGFGGDVSPCAGFYRSCITETSGMRGCRAGRQTGDDGWVAPRTAD
jgi:hypothetical protein